MVCHSFVVQINGRPHKTILELLTYGLNNKIFFIIFIQQSHSKVLFYFGKLTPAAAKPLAKTCEHRSQPSHCGRKTYSPG